MSKGPSAWPQAIGNVAKAINKIKDFHGFIGAPFPFKVRLILGNFNYNANKFINNFNYLIGNFLANLKKCNSIAAVLP